jgi:hypothetical protein
MGEPVKWLLYSAIVLALVMAAFNIALLLSAQDL